MVAIRWLSVPSAGSRGRDTPVARADVFARLGRHDPVIALHASQRPEASIAAGTGQRGGRGLCWGTVPLGTESAGVPGGAG